MKLPSAVVPLVVLSLLSAADSPPLRFTDVGAQMGVTSPNVFGGTNFQGQGNMTSDFNVISSTPNNPSSATSPLITFSSNETATFECSKNNSSWAACTSPYTYTTSAPTITNNYGTFYPWSSCNSSANYCTYSRQNYNGGYYTSSSCLTVGNASTPCYTAISTNALQSTTYTVAQTQGGSTVGTPVTTTVTQQCTAYRAGANTSSNPYVYYLDSSSCANVSGSATPPTSSSEFDPSQLSASNGCAVGIYLSAHQNWVTGGANLAGLGPELDLQAQKVASLTSTSTTSSNCICTQCKRSRLPSVPINCSSPTRTTTTS